MKNPITAAVLAFLIPGAGHWYQGRRFKATIYSVGILTLFAWGMILGNLQPVYSQLVYPTRVDSAQLEFYQPQYKFSYAYAAQVLVGLPALPAVVQELRFRNADGTAGEPGEAVDSEFSGVLRQQGPNGEVATTVRGHITIGPLTKADDAPGVLIVRNDDGTETRLELDSDAELGRTVFGSPERELMCSLAESNERPGYIRGTVRRSFLDWFQAPRDTMELDRLHGDLNRRFDIASVFTWIAGLLNLLAIWDAADGPAYAYGDEKPEDDEEPEPKST